MKLDTQALDPARIREIFDTRSHIRQRGLYEGDPNPDWNRLREYAPVHEGTPGRLIGFEGPELWFGGQRLSEPIMRRLVTYGSGFHPLGEPTDAELAEIRSAFERAGRDFDSLEKVGGIRAVFPDDDAPSTLEDGLASIPPQIRQGYSTFCVKPNQFIDDAGDFESFIRDLVDAFSDMEVAQ